MDRTKPPPGYVVLVANFTEPKLWAPGIEDLGPIGPNNIAYEGAVAVCWKHYDEFTLPARVELLRELAAEWKKRGEDYYVDTDCDEYYQGQQSGVGQGFEQVAEELAKRADALEASGRTEGP